MTALAVFMDFMSVFALVLQTHHSVNVKCSCSDATEVLWVLCPDVSQTSGASGQKAAEGRDRPGAGWSLWGVCTISQDEQQSRYLFHSETQKLMISLSCVFVGSLNHLISAEDFRNTMNKRFPSVLEGKIFSSHCLI